VEDLRSTIDSIQQHARDLLAIEDAKAALPVEDSRVDALSDAAVETADRIARETRAERALSDRID
jgi:hypothetical protein